MADQLQLRRNTTAAIATFTGAQGEIIVDTDKDTIVVQDGATPGGFPLASESAVANGTFYFNDDVSGGSIANSYILSPKANTNTPTSYMDGQQYGFVTANANTGPSTATFSGLGVRSLKWPGGIDPVAGDIFGRVYLIYNSANGWFEIQRKAVAPPPQIRNVTSNVSSNSLIATMPAQTVDFRSTTLGNGATNSRTFSSALSITAPSGATLGTTSGTASRIVILALDNAGVVELGLTNANNNVLTFDETALTGTTAISAGSTSANVVYSATGLSNVPYRVVGFIESTQATAGTWATTPSKVQGQGGQTLIGIPYSRMVLATPQNTASGTAIDFTGIPSWVKRVTLSLNGVSTNGASLVQAQIGSGAITGSGYAGAAAQISSGTSQVALATGHPVTGAGAAADIITGSVVFTLLGGNVWTATGLAGYARTAGAMAMSTSSVTIAGALDRLRLTTVNGTDVFDAGSINILYEG